MAEMTHHAALIATSIGIPVIADADTGYGDVANVERTTEAYVQSGVAAIHLEDQASPKRCGHLGGVRLIDDRAMVAKLQVAIEARERGKSGMLIIGRTDAFKACNLKEAIRRANLYKETGVDILFVDGLTRTEDFRQVRKNVDGRLMGSIVEIDIPAQVRVEDLEAMGYSIAVFALSGIQTAAGALDRLMRDIKAHGDTDRSFQTMMTYTNLNACLGIEHFNSLWNRFYSKRQKEDSQA